MTESWINDPKLVGPIMGIVAAFGILADILIQNGCIDATALMTLLGERADEFGRLGFPMALDAAGILYRLVNSVNSTESDEDFSMIKSNIQGSA